MTMKEEYTAIDMATAAADGFRDGQRAAPDHSAQSLNMVGALVTALDGLLSITQDSAGVAGYHLNGNVAEWDEFPEVITARDVISAYRATDKESLTAADSQASADDSRKLSDLGNELHNLSCHVVHVNEGWAEQIGKIACELWKWPQASAAQVSLSHQFVDAVKQLCKDFSDRQDRPYMGDVYAALDGLLDHEQIPVAAQSATAGERDSYWFSLLMNCAAELETASYCMTDTEAKRVAQSGADYYRDQARAAWQRTQSAGVPDTSELQRVIYNADYNAKRMLDADSFWWSEIATIRVEFERFIRSLAAAPAQPAAQGEIPAEVIAAAIRSVPAWSEISADLLACEIFDYLYPGQKRKTVNGHYINCKAVSQFPAGKCNCGKGE